MAILTCKLILTIWLTVKPYFKIGDNITLNDIFPVWPPKKIEEGLEEEEYMEGVHLRTIMPNPLCLPPKDNEWGNLPEINRALGERVHSIIHNTSTRIIGLITLWFKAIKLAHNIVMEIVNTKRDSSLADSAVDEMLERKISKLTEEGRKLTEFNLQPNYININPHENEHILSNFDDSAFYQVWQFEYVHYWLELEYMVVWCMLIGLWLGGNKQYLVEETKYIFHNCLFIIFSYWVALPFISYKFPNSTCNTYSNYIILKVISVFYLSWLVFGFFIILFWIIWRTRVREKAESFNSGYLKTVSKNYAVYMKDANLAVDPDRLRPKSSINSSSVEVVKQTLTANQQNKITKINQMWNFLSHRTKNKKKNKPSDQDTNKKK